MDPPRVSSLASVKRDGVQADIVTYNTVVTIMAKAGRLEDALEVLRKASADSGVQLDVVSIKDGCRLNDVGCC